MITGRVGDPALVDMAPLIHEFGWAMDDWERLGKGAVVGHLLECAGQITGGYFADPGFKDVAGLGRLGFPIGEVGENGDLVVTKVPGSGGSVTEATCKEQLLYEVHDPSQYLQPDVVGDFSKVTVTQVGPDRVHIQGGSGKPKTGKLKTSVGYIDSYVGAGQISYAGPGALERGRLALEIVRERLSLTGVQMTESRFDLIGAGCRCMVRVCRTVAWPTKSVCASLAAPKASPKRYGSATRWKHFTQTVRQVVEAPSRRHEKSSRSLRCWYRKISCRQP